MVAASASIFSMLRSHTFLVAVVVVGPVFVCAQSPMVNRLTAATQTVAADAHDADATNENALQSAHAAYRALSSVAAGDDDAGVLLARYVAAYDRAGRPGGAYLAIAKRYLARAMAGAARAYLQRAVAIAPQHAQHHSYLGSAAAKRRDFAAAARAHRNALAIDPTLRRSRRLLVVALAADGRFDESGVAYAAAVAGATCADTDPSPHSSYEDATLDLHPDGDPEYESDVRSALVPPPFPLETTTGRVRDGSRWERDEQALLWRWLRPGDATLQIGGGVGATCVTGARRARPPDGATVCVEPNPRLVPVLRRNERRNRRFLAGLPTDRDTQDDVRGISPLFAIIEGIITEDSKAAMTMAGREDDDGAQNNEWAGRVVRRPPATTATTADNVVRPVPFAAVRAAAGGRNFTAVFIDCEGCLCDFWREYGARLLAEGLHAAILEHDVGCDASVDVEPSLRSAGFARVGGAARGQMSADVWVRDGHVARRGAEEEDEAIPF